MASVSVSHMILFIASMVIAASVAGVFTEQVNDLSNALVDQGLDTSEEVRTDIEIISDSGSQIYDRNGNDNVTILVKNTGSEDLIAEEDQIGVIIDGEYKPSFNVTVLNEPNPTWHTNEVVEIQVNEGAAFPTGDHRVKIIVNGDEEVFEFRT